MADEVRLPGVTGQIRLVAGLRWRILRNNMRNKNRRLDAIGLIISSILGAVFVVGLSFAFFAGASAFLTRDRVAWMGLLFWAIFLWWQWMPILIAGFSPSFSFRTLLRFPVSFSAFYVIGIAYGLADSAAVASLVWLAAMCAAVAVTKVSLLPVMLLVCLLFVAFNVALERLLGAWLEKILATRRARELFFGLFMLMIISVQFISPALNKYGDTLKPAAARLLPYFSPFPGSLAGYALAGTARRDWLAMLENLGGLSVYAVVCGTLLAWRYAQQFRGEELSETAAPARPAQNVPKVSRAESGPGGFALLPPAVSAVVLKEVKYLMRNSFSFISLAMPPLLVLLFSTQLAGAKPTATRHALSPHLFFPGMMAYLVLMLMAASYNSFAFEGRGMQTYFMVPVKFRDVLLGKNLTHAAIVAIEITFCAGVVAWRVGLPPTPIFISTMVAVVFAVVGQLTIANWSALSFPKKMEFGKMQGQRNSGMAVLIAFAAQIVFGSVCAVVLFAGQWTGNAWLPTEIFSFLAAAALAGYIASLDEFTRLAERKKEVLLEAMCR